MRTRTSRYSASRLLRVVVAIGHPHDATIDALARWIAALPQKGLVLVPVSAIVRERSEDAMGTTSPSP
jgi:polysaccharide deacetylase 2 family uncharacterized protein YibQ